MNKSKPQELTQLPRQRPDDSEERDPPLATARWLPSSVVLGAIKASNGEKQQSPIILGQLWQDNQNHLFSWDDDRHLVTIAGSRSGKGRSLIIPNLLSYPGSVVCIDPKGENAAVTARHRQAMGQKVMILDPFAVLGARTELADLMGRYNPLEIIEEDQPETIDEVSALADALIIRDNSKDPHWNESARTFLKGVILLLMATLPKYQDDVTPPSGDRDLNWTLEEVRSLVSVGTPLPETDTNSLDGLLNLMMNSEAFGGAVAAAGHLIDQMGGPERGGVLSALRRHTEFLESPAIQAVLSRSSFRPEDINTTPTTIYLVLPEWRMGTHARWLRLMITSLIQILQRAERKPEAAATLVILDEFATLGHMESIERAAGYIAGFGVKLWVILQDLTQLQSLYKGRWETFLGNAGMLTTFGNVDVTTLEYLSKRLGETEVTRTVRNVSMQTGTSENRGGMSQIIDALSHGKWPGALLGNESESTQSGSTVSYQPSIQKTSLLTPDEIARVFARDEETVLVHAAGQYPFMLNRIRYDLDEPFRSKAAKSPYH